MKKMRRIKIIFILFSFFFFPVCIYAYIDPGTGSYFIQLLIAAFVGISFAIRLFWTKIKSFLSFIFSRKKNIDDEG